MRREKKFIHETGDHFPEDNFISPRNELCISQINLPVSFPQPRRETQFISPGVQRTLIRRECEPLITKTREISSSGTAVRPCARLRTREILSDARKPGLYCVLYAVFNPEFISRQGSFIPGVVAAAFNGPGPLLLHSVMRAIR